MIEIKIAENQREIRKAKEIRRQVFQIEQGIDPRLDFDGNDDVSDHIVAYRNNEPIGVARIRYLSEKTVKIERVAVVSAYRKIGIGRKIMDHIIDHLRKRDIKNIIIDSQEHARKFYEEMGFKQNGKVFEEFGIPHIEMRKEI